MAEELARELKICDEVRFVGKQNDMEEIFAVTDLFLLPSEYESFGLAALEAMAAGAAVVSSNAGGLPEVIEQGICGYMANVGDTTAMSNYAFDILKDNDRLQQFKNAAKSQALKFDIHNIIPQYEKLYDSVAKGVVAAVHK
jgi:glycosyltransferase involved in cell wall biosynthesis